MKNSVIWGVALVLVLAMAIQMRPGKEPGVSKGRHLDRVLPATLAGWQGRSLPLGSTEVVQDAVEKTLRFDDVYFHEFASSTGTISLYVAYWGAGKMPTQLVASHTPDRCWTSAGWVCQSAQHGIPVEGAGTILRAGEWRVFVAPGSQKLEVQFWHLVGTETYDYGNGLNKVPSVWRWWRDAARQVFQAPPEQYFIRLASDVPFAQLRRDPGWNELLEALAGLGLRNQPPLKN